MISDYTDSQIQFIIDCKKENGFQWQETTDKFNKKFGCNKSKNAIMKTYDRYQNINFAEDSYLDNAKKTYSMRKMNSYISRENKTLLQHLTNADEIKTSINEIIKNTKFKLYPVPKTKITKTTSRTIIAHLSDTHYGSIVKKNHNGGINEYDNTIAARRTAYFFWQIAEYAKPNIESTNLVLLINGDIFAGVIHDAEGVELLSQQFKMVITILGQGITYLANKFQNVSVRVTSGNHDRTVIEKDKGRAIVNKFDSYATMAYLSLQRELKQYKNISFHIDEKPFLDFKVFDYRIYATHGDTMFNVGVPSKNIKMNEISAQINRINNSDLVKDKKFDMFFLAHMHTPVVTTAEGGEYVFINGSLIGLDSFAQSIGINVNKPIQQFVELTKKHIGNLRFCSLQEADTNPIWDKIITII